MGLLLRVTALWLSLVAPFAWAKDSLPLIRLGYDDFCPYTCLNSSEKGYFTDVVVEILKAKGYRIETVIGSWARLKIMAQKSELEIVVPLTRFETEELKIDRNTVPLGRIEGRLFTHKSNPWRYKEEASLKGQSIAIIRDYGYPPPILALMNDPEQSRNILTLSSDQGTELQVKMLANQRVSVIPSDRNAFLYHARRQGVEASIRIAGELPMDPLYTDLHVGIASRAPELRQKLRAVLDAGIEELRKSGGLDRLKAKYGVN